MKRIILSLLFLLITTPVLAVNDGGTALNLTNIMKRGLDGHYGSVQYTASVNIDWRNGNSQYMVPIPTVVTM